MSQPELLKLVSVRLEQAGIAWMLTGSIASSMHGEPRATHDIDLVISVSGPVDEFVQKLKWAQMSGGSTKQYGDALRVYEVQHGVLDMPYMEHWAVALGITELFERIRAEARPLA